MSRSRLREFQACLDQRDDRSKAAHLEFIAGQLESYHRWQASDVKKMCQAAIKQFFVDDPHFNDDENFLRILQVLTRYSRNMGSVGIYQQMDELGFFQTSKKFYYLWAEALAERRMQDGFKAVVAKAVSKIGLVFADLDVFIDLSNKHLQDSVNFEEFCPDEGERTVAFFVPNKKARRRSVAFLEQAAKPSHPLPQAATKMTARLRMVCMDREEDGYVGISFEERRAAEWEDTQNVHDNNAASADVDMDISMDVSMAPVPVPAARPAPSGPAPRIALASKRVEEREEEESKRMRIHSPQKPTQKQMSVAGESPMGSSFTTHFTSKAMSVFSDTVLIDSRHSDGDASPQDKSLVVPSPAPAQFEIFSETLHEQEPAAAAPTPIENMAPPSRPAPLPLERPAERRPLGLIPVPKPADDKKASMFADLIEGDDDLPPRRSQEMHTDSTLASESSEGDSTRMSEWSCARQLAFDVYEDEDEEMGEEEEEQKANVNVLNGLMKEAPHEKIAVALFEDEETVAGTKFLITGGSGLGGQVTSTPFHPNTDKPPVLDDFFAGQLPDEEEDDDEDNLLFGNCDATKSAFMQRRLSIHGNLGSAGRLSLAPKQLAIPEEKDKMADDENANKSESLMSAIGSMKLEGTLVVSPKEHENTPAVEKEEEEQEEDVLNSTGVGLNSVVTSSVNPWGSDVRVRIMRASLNDKAHMHEYECKAPVMKSGKSVELGGHKYTVGELIGKGGYAHVYKCVNESGHTVAVKYEIPACAWEAWICDQLRRRLADSTPSLHSIMEVTDAYIYSNASLLANEFIPFGTLLDLGNKYKDMSPMLLLYLGLQVASILRDVHCSGVIHADAKPDNFMLLGKLDECWDASCALSRRLVRLIDWGRAIDMRALNGKTFTGRAGTDNFDCPEMMEGREWTFQTDFFAFLGTMYVLINGQYMSVSKMDGRYRLDKPLRRRMDARNLWVDLFDELLNISSCDRLPCWDGIIDKLEKAFRENFKSLDWKMAVRRFNEALPQQ